MESKTVFEVFIEGYGDNPGFVCGIANNYDELIAIIKSFSGDNDVIIRKLKVI
jgi:hypothetical protein